MKAWITTAKKAEGKFNHQQSHNKQEVRTEWGEFEKGGEEKALDVF